MWVVAHLPFSWQMRIGQALGLLSFYVARERRHVCEVNLQLCFPELSDSERHQLARKNFISYGIGLIEIAIAWNRMPHSYESRVQVSGMKHLDEALARGKGVLLVCAHFTTIEMGGFLFTLLKPLDVTYRPNKNPLMQALMFDGRLRVYNKVIGREDVRSAIRSLKTGNILWYGPDQDYGPKHSVFVPFFGVEAATITATSRFARANDSAVVFYSHYRNADNSGYHLAFSPALTDYPSADETQDALRMNQIIETAIRKQPDQYLWLHKRFKTQAAGKAARPY